MKILYVGQLGAGGTCRDRMLALQRLRQEVVGIDVTVFQSSYRLLRSMQWHWHPRRLLEGLNRHVVEFAKSMGRLDCMWVDKGIWIFPETLRTIKATTNCQLVHYTPDSQILTNRSRHFLESIPIYDMLLSTKSFEMDLYRELGARRVMFVTQSYCPVRFSSPEPKQGFVHDIGFVSDYKKPYGRIVSNLVAAVPDIAVWGPNWRSAARWGSVPSNLVKGDGLWGPDYVNALASFRIGLGLLSKYIPEQHTTRSFEIPAAGTFLLAERTKEHQEFFEEGQEAEFFDSSEELAAKARFYLRRDSVRQNIALRGRARCRRSGYDNDSVLARVLKEIA